MWLLGHKKDYLRNLSKLLALQLIQKQAKFFFSAIIDGKNGFICGDQETQKTRDKSVFLPKIFSNKSFLES